MRLAGHQSGMGKKKKPAEGRASGERRRGDGQKHNTPARSATGGRIVTQPPTESFDIPFGSYPC
jgi:hypothetical protein